MVYRTHRQSDVVDPGVDRQVRVMLELPGEDLGGAALIRLEELVPVVSEKVPEALTAVDQTELRPDVEQAVRCWRAGECDHPGDFWQNTFQGLEPLRLVVLKR